MLNRNSVFVLLFYESPVVSVTVTALGNSFSVQKTLRVVRLCQMQGGLIYVNINSVIDCVYYRVVLLRIIKCDSFSITRGRNFTYKTGW
jgi:hypothetical protein